MTDTHTPADELTSSGVDRQIGGERAHRGFFGGTQPKGRVIGLAIAFLAMLVLTPVLGIWGLAIAVALGVTVILVTLRTHRGSLIERQVRRRRWRQRQLAGTDRFEPFDQARWDQIQAAARSGTKPERASAARELAAMRTHPDGADGMGWLQSSSREPGIAWHAPLGEEPYLSVVFAVTGQAHGVESASAMRRAAEAWGLFLASRAAPTNLIGEIQTLTRVLPADSALQEFWILESLDDTVPADAIASYDDVLRLTGMDAMVQRHYITARWPLGAAFMDAARKYGAGRDGWRGLMRQEIASTLRGLTDARLGEVEALTARKVVAVMQHQQNPSRPIDYLPDVEPTRLGLRSRDEFSATVVSDRDPVSGEAVEWWHRTAAIRSEDLAVGSRNQLWTLDLLIGSDIQFVRSISFHLRLIPKGDAKAAARNDLVRDRADLRSDLERGRIVNDERRGVGDLRRGRRARRVVRALGRARERRGLRGHWAVLGRPAVGGAELRDPLHGDRIRLRHRRTRGTRARRLVERRRDRAHGRRGRRASVLVRIPWVPGDARRPASGDLLAMADPALAARLELSGAEADVRRDFAAVGRAAAQGDAACATLIEGSARYVAQAMLSVVNLLDLDRVYLAGPGFAEAGPIYLQVIRDVVTRFARTRDIHGVEVVLSDPARDAAAVGAAALALQQSLTPHMVVGRD
ncbi:hypothetical protein GCM10025881_15580 [Pseudolysinimonas kribbensis]|uniref:ROK family protein n=1 Tax=Pseudolysinimonas kribbensis TaxID=433641 RepID=A0ABQ6K5M5_9MICO|nr:hypothetical protein GCM10025881_15580 [Pseudolysinimonas kribbensis]